MSFSRRSFVSFAASVLGGLGLTGGSRFARAAMTVAAVDQAGADGAANPNLSLWFNQPAAQWSDALPVGNGRLGGMIFGGIASERVALNEDTLWSGAPSDWNNPGAKAHLPVVRKLVLEDKNYQAADAECLKMEGPWNQAYEPLGDLRIEFDHGVDAASYRRDLDLDSAVAGVQYVAQGVKFTREFFSSQPDNVILVRLKTDKSGALTCTVKLTTQLRGKSESKTQAATQSEAQITLTGKAPSQSLPQYIEEKDDVAVQYSPESGKGMYFAAVLHCKATDGKVSAQPDGSLRIEDATSVILAIGAATGYRGYSIAPDMPLNVVVAAAGKPAAAAIAQPYEALLNRHLADYRKLFRRVSLEIGPSPAGDAQPTPLRVANFASHPDPGLLALLFHYGRYLLISSSRPGTQPANLQGIWNGDVRPPWSCNWTTNINVQMNYWLAETCNLSELHLPLLEMVQDLSVNGRKTAEVNYGTPGWVSHHNVDLWRQSGPAGGWGVPWASPTWANYCMSGPWLCAHLWEHYRFTGDTEYLRKTAYPVMKGSAEFCLDWLIEDGNGGLTTCPSVSTENIFKAPNGKPAAVSAGCTMDVALIGEIFRNCAEASSILGIDSMFASKLSSTAKRLPSFKIGGLGQLQEWSIDFEEQYPGMRHMSQLYPLYPGSAITPKSSPELARAARVSLERRLKYANLDGGGFTGWGRAWAIALWARLGDGDKAWESLQMLVKHSLNGNLFDDVNDTNPKDAAPVTAGIAGFIFQIDANFGSPAAIAEMLLQSHEEEIAILPAWPADWTQGKVTGLRARGGAEIDISWSSKRAVAATVRILTPGDFRFRAPVGQRFSSITREAMSNRQSLSLPSGAQQIWKVTGRPGETYHLTFATS